MLEAKDIEDLISTKEAAKLIGCSAGHLSNMRHHGGGPSAIKLGYNCVKYDKDVVDSWIEQRKREKIAAIMGA